MKYYFLFITVLAISIKGFSQTKIVANAVAQHVGDSVVVEGKISDTSYSQTYGAIVLQIAQPNGGSFDVLIKNENRNNFPFLGQIDVFNKNVRIIGKIVSQVGRNRIYVTAGRQLAVILGE